MKRRKGWDRDHEGIVGDVLHGKFLKRGKGRAVVGKTGGEVLGISKGNGISGIEFKIF